ncbi:MAG: hypothetical protein IKC48_03880 [Clostridia bacterium]|nr:hypothetical protein [Clostridia bacterium]
MVTVNEFSYDEAKDIVKALGGKLSADERVLIMDENGQKIGAAVIGLDRTVVEIRQLIVKDRPFPYFDLLARSTLNIINLFELPIMVRVENNPYIQCSASNRRRTDLCTYEVTKLRLRAAFAAVINKR